MQVLGASVTLSAQHQLRQRQALTPLPAIGESARTPGLQRPAPQTAQGGHGMFPNASLPAQPNPVPAEEPPLSPRLQLMRLMIEYLSGEKIILPASPQQPSSHEANAVQSAPTNIGPMLQTDTNATEAKAPQRFHLSLSEREYMNFTLDASLTLTSGKTLTIAISEQRMRQLEIEKTIDAEEARRRLDPLVLNFGSPLSLSERKVDFDLNADGTEESIATLASNSAYLALDRNGDGEVNNGSELFGALSGNGFADLAQFDGDGNGFIDSGDAVFDQLLLFRPGDQPGQLQRLASAGVEALYLGNTSTPYTLTDRAGDPLGHIRATGFFLSQASTAGNGSDAVRANTLQQIDLVV